MKQKTIRPILNNIPLELETHSDLFSPNQPDRGTLAMLSCVEFKPGDKVLDLGCGYGLVGILAAKLIGAENVTMVDNDAKCIEYSKKNAEKNGVPAVQVIQSDGFDNLDTTDFTLILCNPPYHVDFAVPKRFVHKGFNRLVPGGRFYMVTKRHLWYKNKFTGIFGGTKVKEIDGYFVFMSVKKTMTYAKVENPELSKIKIGKAAGVEKKAPSV